jgi:hypothetical protein
VGRYLEGILKEPVKVYLEEDWTVKFEGRDGRRISDLLSEDLEMDKS